MAERPSTPPTDRSGSPPGPAPAALAALLATAVAGQIILDGDLLGFRISAPPGTRAIVAAGLLLAAAAAWLALTRSEDTRSVPLLPPVSPSPATLRFGTLAAGVAVAIIPAIARPDGPVPELVRFGPALGRSHNALGAGGAALWLAGLMLVAGALGLRRGGDRGSPRTPRSMPRATEVAAFACIIGIAAWFRFVDLATLPPEMISDHAEKLLDVRDVLEGARPVFFAANGGREPLQFYLTAALVSAGIPLGFSALKIGMTLVGLATVPATLWLGRELGGTRLGLVAAAVTAVMPWHLNVGRLGLRAPFSPLFSTLALAALVRALRTGSRRSWLACGLLTGAGLYGYTGFRPMVVAAPMAVVAALLVAGTGRAARRQVAGHAAAAALLAVLVALPLLRVAAFQPDVFWARSAARLAPTAHGSTVPIAGRLVDGWTKTLLMANRTSDPTWALNPALRPALDPVGGGLLVVGLAAAASRIRRRDWRLAAAVAAAPAMLAASAMAIGFPGEIPHQARAAGAIPVVAVLVALPLDRLLAARGRSRRRLVAAATAVALLAAMSAFSARRLLVEGRAGYAVRCRPVSLGAAVAHDWIDRGGAPDRVILVGWPHGWDWRAFALELGEPDWHRVHWGEGQEMRGAVDEVERDPEGNLVLLGGPSGGRDAAALARRYQGSEVTAHSGHGPDRGFWSVEIPPAR